MSTSGVASPTVSPVVSSAAKVLVGGFEHLRSDRAILLGAFLTTDPVIKAEFITAGIHGPDTLFDLEDEALELAKQVAKREIVEANSKNIKQQAVANEAVEFDRLSKLLESYTWRMKGLRIDLEDSKPLKYPKGVSAIRKNKAGKNKTSKKAPKTLKKATDLNNLPIRSPSKSSEILSDPPSDLANPVSQGKKRKENQDPDDRVCIRLAEGLGRGGGREEGGTSPRSSKKRKVHSRSISQRIAYGTPDRKKLPFSFDLIEVITAPQEMWAHRFKSGPPPIDPEAYTLDLEKKLRVANRHRKFLQGTASANALMRPWGEQSTEGEGGKSTWDGKWAPARIGRGEIATSRRQEQAQGGWSL